MYTYNKVRYRLFRLIAVGVSNHSDSLKPSDHDTNIMQSVVASLSVCT